MQTTNKKCHMAYQRVSLSVTLNDLEVYYFGCFVSILQSFCNLTVKSGLQFLGFSSRQI